MADTKRLHATIEGRVQGVGFRHFTLQRARQFPIKGWVRNLNDGRVEVVAEGDSSDLETFLDHLKQGPPAGHVSDVNTEWSDAQGDLSGFDVKY